MQSHPLFDSPAKHINLCIFIIVNVLFLTACGGGGGSTDNTNTDPITNTDPVTNTGNTSGTMNHEIAYDPALATKPAAAGQMVNSVFGSTHEDAQIVFNSSGVGMAVWQTTTTDSESGKAVYAVYNPILGSWSAENTLFVVTNESPPATRLSLAASSTGFAISWMIHNVYSVTAENASVWNDFNYAKVYQNGTWSKAMLLNIDPDPIYLSSPKVSSNNSSFLFVWQENSYLVSREWSASGMSAAVPALSISSSLFEDMDIVSNGSDYMLKVEHGLTFSTGSRHMSALRYTAGSWSAATNTETSVGGITKSVIASDGNGYMMTWVQDGATYYSIFSSGSWSAMAAISGGPTSTHQLTSNGNSYLLSWVSSSRLNVKTFSSGSWGITELPESINGNIDSHDATGTSSGYAFSLRAYDLSTSSYTLFLLDYNGGSSGTTVLAEQSNFKVFDHTVAFGDNQTWLAWQQFDGTDMQQFTASFQATTVATAERVLSSKNHGAGVTSGKVATTALGVKVAAWSQTYFDATGAEKTGAFARAGSNGSLGAPVLLRNIAKIREVITLGETVVVLMKVVDGISAIEYTNGAWSNVTSLTGSFVYSWEYRIANNRLMLVWENVNNLRAAVFDSGSWSPVTNLSTSGESTGYPVLASNGDNFMVAWKEWLLTNTNTINSRFYDASLAQWNAVSTIETYESTIGGYDPKISSNGSGFMIAWTRADTVSDTSPTSLFVSLCDGLSGVCGASTSVENLTTSILGGGFKQASNNTGYMIVFTNDQQQKYVVYDGVNWGNPDIFSAAGYISKIIGDADDYLAIWYEYGEGNPINASRYTSGNGWSLPEAIVTGDASVQMYQLQLIPVAGGYTLAWLAHKPDHFYQLDNLHTTTWNGTGWSAVQQINTGMFDVRSYHYHVVNDVLSLSWVQAHESLEDPAAPALWELAL